MKYYAIRFGDWIEVRVASKAPAKSRTRVALSKRKGIKDTLEAYVYGGGEVVGYIKSTSFTRIVNIAIGRNAMTQIPTGKVKVLKEKLQWSSG